MLAEYIIFACQENISFALLSLSLLGDDITMSVCEREMSSDQQELIVLLIRTQGMIRTAANSQMEQNS